MFLNKSKLKPRISISEVLIHFLFAIFVFTILKIAHIGQFQVYLGYGTLFFVHALVMIPKLLDKKIITYLINTSFLIFIAFIFGFIASERLELSKNEVVPIITIIMITSGGYGTIRWTIIKQLNEYAFTAEGKTAELQLLKSQINPHFIFNSLNILYATALEEKSEKTAESIAKMSNMMRYMLEDNTQEFVSIHKEVKYLKDYIKLQLMRSSVEHNIDLNIDISYDHTIAPMLLIPFVENAFKHGIHPNKSSTLFLNFISSPKKIYFQLINEVDHERSYADFEKGFGIGIDNVEKRLKLIYPRRHKLSIGQENNTFSVVLEIEHS